MSLHLRKIVFIFQARYSNQEHNGSNKSWFYMNCFISFSCFKKKIWSKKKHNWLDLHVAMKWEKAN
jgi:hypothetical protein